MDAAGKSDGGAQSVVVIIPPDIHPGMQFLISQNGQRFMVTCPDDAGPNKIVEFKLPSAQQGGVSATVVSSEENSQILEVKIPSGAQPGRPFVFTFNGTDMAATCPPSAVPGQNMLIRVYDEQLATAVKLCYEGSEPWFRTLRVPDLKFQWARKEEGMGEWMHSAFARKLTIMEGKDPCIRAGILEMIPAQEAVVDSKLMSRKKGKKAILSYAHIVNVYEKPFEEKVAWFRGVCNQVIWNWEDGHIQFVLRRSHLLQDSVDSVKGLKRKDLRKNWKFEYSRGVNEEAEELSHKEWLEFVSQQLFDADKGLWLPSSSTSEMRMTINSCSSILCPDDLTYFRFLGRVIGRALLFQQVIKGRMVQLIYKHLLGWPVGFKDLELDDEGIYQSFKTLAKMDDVSSMSLNFTVEEERFGTQSTVNLVEGGAFKEVTNENLFEYLEANLRYRLLGRIEPQLTQLLLGFFDIIPESALSAFGPSELERMLCDPPTTE